MVISEVETCAVPVLLKESDITEASLAGRNQQNWEKLIFCFGSDSSMIVKAYFILSDKTGPSSSRYPSSVIKNFSRHLKKTTAN